MTPTQRLADALLRAKGSTLVDFVIERADLGVPGEAIARQLAEHTDGEVTVTGQAIRTWTAAFRAERGAAA